MSSPRHFADLAHVGRRRGARSLRQRVILGLGITLALMSLSGTAVAGYVLVKYLSVDRVTGLGIDEAPPGEPENYLIVGSDNREGVDGKRTDTIMVLRVEPADETADLVSFPRDLVVQLAGTGRTGLINAAYSMDDGEQVLIDTIRQNFGIPIHHYVEVGFDGFERLVDELGGVPLWFDEAVRDRRSGLHVTRRGCVTLSGKEALGFVRSRHIEHRSEGRWVSDPLNSDLTRVERQQVFVRQAVAEALEQLKSSRNPTKLASMIDIAVDSVRLDDTIGLGDIEDLASRFRDVAAGALATHPLPVVEHPADPDRVALDDHSAAPILNIFRGLDPGDISPDLVGLTVLNGTDEDGLANDASGAFAAVGFDLREPGNVPVEERPERTVVRHAPDEEDYGLRVVRHITGGAELEEDPALEEHEVEVVLGPDFTTVHDQPTPLDKLPEILGTGGSPAAGASGGEVGAAAGEGTAPDGASEAGAAGGQADESATTTTDAPTTTTTRPRDVVGEPPRGESC
ncbi:MAG TPA: LCP family protein [Acidimicrobiales bacterium]